MYNLYYSKKTDVIRAAVGPLLQAGCREGRNKTIVNEKNDSEPSSGLKSYVLICPKFNDLYRNLNISVALT